MIRLTLSTFLWWYLCFPGTIVAQTLSFSSELKTIDQYSEHLRDTLSPFDIYDITLPHIKEPFLSLTIKIRGGIGNRSSDEVFLSTEGESDWEKLSFDPHLGEGVHKLSSLIFLYPGQTSIHLKFPGEKFDPKDIELHWFHPGSSAQPPESQKHLQESIYRRGEECKCDYPLVWERSHWCPFGQCPEQQGGIPSHAGHFIVHHSAGANQSSDWPAVVRSIWNQHVNINGWADIGYHYLIDSEGVIYRGRKPNIQGAHFCATNSNTLGVCLLGNFNIAFPNPNATSSATELLGWYFCDKELDPHGSSLHSSSGLFLKNLSGHRDGCSTDCPGNAWYPQLNNLRDSVEEYINSTCVSEPLPAPQIDHAWIETDQLFILYSYPLDSSELTGFVVEYKFDIGGVFDFLDSVYSFTRPLIVDYYPAQESYIRMKAFTEGEESDWSNIFLARTGTSQVNEMTTEQFVVFPNPANHEISFEKTNLESDIDMQVEIKGINGRSVLSDNWFAGTETYQWDTKGVPSGTYLYLIRSGNRIIYSGKIVLVR